MSFYIQTDNCRMPLFLSACNELMLVRWTSFVEEAVGEKWSESVAEKENFQPKTLKHYFHVK